MKVKSVRAVSRPGNTGGSRLPMLASWAVIVALMVQESVSGLGVGTSSWSGTVVVGKMVAIGTSILYVVVQLRIVRGIKRSTTRGFGLLLIVGAGAALAIDGQWAPLPLALSALMLMLPPIRAAFAVASILVALYVYVGIVSPHLVVVMPPGVLAFAVVLYAFARLSVVIRELQLAREELARTRVNQERLRMQRDLHDVLGRTLVAASLRNQVALRTLDSDPRAAREHLEQLHTVLTEGQARLRLLTSGPIIVSLSDEIESASALCHRLGIEISVDADPLPVDAPDREVGAVVRESVTNLLKHSSARHCSLTIHTEPTAIVVTMVNDGCISGATQAPTDGTGLSHLRGLANHLGGTLAAEFLDERRFRISAQFPRASVPGPAPVGRVAAEAREQR